MFLAQLDDGSRVPPTATGQRAVCPGCRLPVLSRCGELVAWHWAHESGADCDTWSEGESAWHRSWKERFPEFAREVVIGPHRADIAINGRVLELQHSKISTDTIREREEFYGSGLIWLFDMSTRPLPYRSDGVLLFPQNKRRSMLTVTRPLLLDGINPEKLFAVALEAVSTSHEEQFLAGSWVDAANLVSFLSDNITRLDRIPSDSIHTPPRNVIFSRYPFPDSRVNSEDWQHSCVNRPPPKRATSAPPPPEGLGGGVPPTSADLRQPLLGAEVVAEVPGRRSSGLGIQETPFLGGGGRAEVVCMTCGGLEWWTSTRKVIICRRCHPPASLEVELVVP